MTSVPCPCCGAQMASPGLEALRYVTLPRMERRVLDELIDAYPKSLSIQQLVNLVWADDPTGGPDTANNSISVYLHHIRRKLSDFGWSAGRIPGSYAGVRLWPLPVNGAAS